MDYLTASNAVMKINRFSDKIFYVKRTLKKQLYTTATPTTCFLSVCTLVYPCSIMVNHALCSPTDRQTWPKCCMYMLLTEWHLRYARDKFLEDNNLHAAVMLMVI